MRDIVSEIKNRLSIEDVVSQYVVLKKAGRYYKALSPFQTEKTPSFVVSPEKQIAYCFSTHKGGDMFKFIQDIEGVDFSEAVRILADKAGLESPKSGAFSEASKKEKSLRDELLTMHEAAADFYEKALIEDSAVAKGVLDYLYKRGVTDELIKDFRIGYAPEGYENLKKFLLKEGFKNDLIMKSGLMTIKDSLKNDVMDKFRGRLMVPILDHMGRVIAFGGRALKEGQDPKYLNSPDTPLYLKRNVLFGLSHAKQAIRDKGVVIFVEGYFDVIMLHKAGIKNVVASSGTALSTEQVNLVRRYASTIVACFDTDRAGLDATKRAYQILQPFDITMKTLVMPKDIKDPADFVLAKGEAAQAEFSALVDGAKDFIEFYSERIAGGFDVTTLDGGKKFLNEMIPLVKMAVSSVRIDHYVRILTKIIGVKETVVYDEIAKFKGLPDAGRKNGVGSGAHGALTPSGVSGSNDHEGGMIGVKMSTCEILLGIALEVPKHFEILAKELKEEDFEGELKDIYIAMRDQYNPDVTSKEGWNFDGKKFASVSGKIDVLALYAEEKYSNFAEETTTTDVEKLIDKLKKQRRMYKRLQVERALKVAQESHDKDKEKELLKEFLELLKQ